MLQAFVEKIIKKNIILSHFSWRFFNSWKRKIRHFDGYFNSSFEGSNNGFKRSSISINPSMGLEKPMTVLSTKGERKRKMNFKELYLGYIENGLFY